MNWLRILLDGIAMSAAFNLATAAVMAASPVTFTTCYPREIQKIAPVNPHALRDKSLFTLLVIVPILLYGSLSACLSGVTGFRNLFWTGYLETLLINFGDFFGLDLLFREKMGARLELPGTEGHPLYTRSGWMKSLAVPEHFIQWPLAVCPLFGLIIAGLGSLIGPL